MSNDALSWAWAAAIPSGPKFVLVALADHGSDHSGEDWTCFPSVQRLADRTGFSRASIGRHLKWLEDEGWISMERRRRPDGTRGIYDFRLHRTPGRATPPESVSEHGVEGETSPEEPGVNLQHGPGGKSSPAMLQNGGQPCCNLRPQEPSGEPSREPSQGAGAREADFREPGSDGFDAGFAAYHETGRRRTSLDAARAAWAWAVGLVGVEALIAAVIAYVEHDPDLKTGRWGAPKFEDWLSGERWRFWLDGGPMARSLAARAVFAGPAEVRAAAVAARGEDWVRAYLDFAEWREGGVVVAQTGVACLELGKALIDGALGQGAVVSVERRAA